MAAERAAEDMRDARRGAALVARAQAAEQAAEATVNRTAKAADEANAALVEAMVPDRAAATRERAMERYRRDNEAAAQLAADEQREADAVETNARAKIATPLCQRRVRQLSLDMFVLMGGEWFTENAQACPCANVA